MVGGGEFLRPLPEHAPGDVLELRGEPLLQVFRFLLAVFQLFQQVGVGGAQGGGLHGAVGGQAGLRLQAVA